MAHPSTRTGDQVEKAQAPTGYPTARGGSRISRTEYLLRACLQHQRLPQVLLISGHLASSALACRRSKVAGASRCRIEWPRDSQVALVPSRQHEASWALAPTHSCPAHITGTRAIDHALARRRHIQTGPTVREQVRGGAAPTTVRLHGGPSNDNAPARQRVSCHRIGPAACVSITAHPNPARSTARAAQSPSHRRQVACARETTARHRAISLGQLSAWAMMRSGRRGQAPYRAASTPADNQSTPCFPRCGRGR